MSTLDKWLPLWIGLAMVVGLLLGRFVPALSDFLARLEVGGISVPIGIGLLVMMYPCSRRFGTTKSRQSPATNGSSSLRFC